ncbi:MAG: L-threonylcarbamoyladenylate synthase [Planctomycetota bacterium]|nr:L-threonylcarbamoyladenylate synthase [Planctomycetota bacterium]
MPPLVIDIRSADDSRDVVHRAVQALAEGKLVVFPTETVYAMAASALNAGAVQRLLAVKRRQPGETPLTLAIKSADDALDYIPNMSRLALRLARRCWPGPVTLVCPDNHPDSLITQLPQAVRQAVVPSGTLGLRVPGHQTFIDVLRMLAGPVVISSANRTKEPESLTAQDAAKALEDDVQLILDDGRSRFGQPSTVVRVDKDQMEILRPGVVSEQTLRRLSSFLILFACTGNTCRSPMAEAMCRKLLADRLGCKIEELEDRGIMVMSAGLSASMGGRPAAEAVEAMHTRGIDLTPHESQALTANLVRHADVIWAMTRSHRQDILAQWPEAARRCDLLCLDMRDIPDPIGGPLEYYQQCADSMELEINARLKQLEIN